MNRELAWSIVFVLGLGTAACGEATAPEGEPESFVEPSEEQPASQDGDPVDAEDDPELPVETPPVMEVPEEPQDPDEEPEEPVPVERPTMRCTENVVQEEPYPQQLPGWDAFEFDVQIAPETTSFQVVGYNERDNGAVIEAMTLPDGVDVDLWTDPVYSRYFQAWFSTTRGSVAALPFPATADQTGRVQTGMYTFRGLSQDTEFCHYVVEEEEPGSVLRLNVFFVGVEGVDASTAETNEDWTEVEEIVANTFAAAGVEVEMNYVEIPEELVERHRDPRSFENLNTAAAELVDAADPLPMQSIDVFLFEEWGGEIGRMHGMARGIPEATGIHGAPGNGVVMQTLGMLGFEGVIETGEIVGNIEIGLTISHEVGHLLGLFHTSEFYAAAWDTADDTPECQNASQSMAACPDSSNLMFPLGPLYMSSELSEDQVAKLVAHPSLARR